MLFLVEKLLQASLDKKVYIFILPSIYDLELIKKWYFKTYWHRIK